MKDFRIAHAKTILKINSIQPIRGFLPLSLLVIGDRLDRTEEVTYNGLQANEFVISAPNRLIVRIPESQVGKALRDLQVLSSVSMTRLPTVVSLEISRSSPGAPDSQKVTGTRAAVGGYSLIPISSRNRT